MKRGAADVYLARHDGKKHNHSYISDLGTQITDRRVYLRSVGFGDEKEDLVDYTKKHEKGRREMEKMYEEQDFFNEGWTRGKTPGDMRNMLHTPILRPELNPDSPIITTFAKPLLGRDWYEHYGDVVPPKDRWLSRTVLKIQGRKWVVVNEENNPDFSEK